MKTRYEESFLFPSSQLDFRRGEIFPAGQLHGLGATEAQYAAAFPDAYANIKSVMATLPPGVPYTPPWDEAPPPPPPPPAPTQAELDAAAAKYVADLNAKAEAADAAARQAAALQASADFMAQQGAQQAAQQAQAQADEYARQAAANKAAADAALANSTQAIQQQAASDAAARQAAADAAAASKKITTLALDADANGVYLFGKYSDGSDAVLARGAAAIDAWFKANGVDQGSAGKTAAYVKAVSGTQTAAVDTTSNTVQHTDTASGTTTTANAKTGAITVTTASGDVASGTGRIIAGGIITTIDQNTGTVTTQNTQTGVVTQTDSTTGKTVTAVQVGGGSSTGGDFMIPDTGKVVTTTAPITGGGTDAGKLALVGLLGLLLLRGAIK